LTAKKAPCVDMKTDVHKDPRFEVLGELAGYNKYEAIGRCTLSGRGARTADSRTLQTTATAMRCR
jgi:hypothetical protein